MDPRVALQRLGYRLASRILGVVWVIARVRRAGVKCVITDGDRMLLVRHSYGSRAWDLPGGAGRRGESAPVIARREMAEELGIEISAWRDLGTLRSVRGRHRVHILTAEVPAPELRVDPVELQAAAWFDSDRLPLWTSPLLTAVLNDCPVRTENQPDPTHRGPRTRAAPVPSRQVSEDVDFS